MLDNSSLLEANEELRLELKNAKNQMDALILTADSQWNTDGNLTHKILKVEELLTTYNQKLMALDTSLTTDAKIEQLLENLAVSNKNHTALQSERDRLQSDFDQFKEKSAVAVDMLNEKLANLENELDEQHIKSKQLLESKKPIKKEITPALQPRKKLRQVDDVFSKTVTNTANEPKRIPKRIDRGSTEINYRQREHRSGSSASGSVKRARTASANQGQVIVSFSSKLVQYSRRGLILQVRANREVEETTTLEWSAECATPWSRYENLRGQIDINIGESIGKIVIDDDNIEAYVQTIKHKSIHRASSVSQSPQQTGELVNVEQIVIRLDEVKYGNALIKRDQRRCHIALVDDSKLRNYVADNTRLDDILVKTRSAAYDLYDELDTERPTDETSLIQVVSDLRDHLAQNNAKIRDQLNQKLEELEKNIKALSNEKGNEISELTDTVSARDKLIEQLQSELDTLRAQLNTAENQGSDLNSQVEGLSKENEELLAQIAKLQEKLTGADDALVNVKGEIGNLLEAIKKLENEIEDLKRQLTEKTDQLVDTNQNLDATRMKRDEYETENAELTARLQKTDADLTELQEKLKKLEAGFDELKQFGDEAATRYANVQASSDKLKLQLDLEEQNNQKLSDENSRLSANVVGIGTQLDTEKAARTALEKANKILEDEIERLKAEIALRDKSSGDMAEETKLLREELAKMRSDLERTQNEQGVLSEMIEALQKQKKDNENEINELKRQIIQKDEDIAQMEGGIERLSSKLDVASRETVAEKESREKTVAKMKNKLKEVEDKRAELMTKTASLENEKMALKLEQENLREEIIQAKEKNIASEGKHLSVVVKEPQEVLAGRSFGAKERGF